MKSFIETFTETAARYPEIPAIVSPRGSISYDDLEERAATIGTQLKEIGIGPESVVGLCMEPSPDLIASMIGTWYAGAAFLPLDPSLPKHRLAVMALDARAAVILTENGTGLLFSGMSTPLIDVATIESYVIADPHPTRAEDLAYIEFVSGSSGLPNGVQIEQRGILPRLQDGISRLELGPRNRTLLYPSASFDAGFWAIGTTLLSGATLYLETAEKLRKAPELLHTLEKNAISHLTLPSTSFKYLKPELLPPAFKALILTGDAPASESLRAWTHPCRVLFGHSLTESPFFTSLTDTPLRQPVSGGSYHLVDGELAVSGPSLARGYLNRPELTREKFIMQNGVRMFRTGERAEKTPEGWRGLGRSDRQIHLRGLRIEAGELEAALREFPSVQEALVLKRPLRRGEKREGLVAFLVPVFDMTIEKEPLKAHLSKRLPRWLLPQWLEVLEFLPRSESGAIDLATLAELELPIGNKPPAETPNSEKARILMETWQEVLGLEFVSVDEEFFELGGDSLTAFEVMVAAEAKGLRIPARLFTLARPTIRIILENLESAAPGPVLRLIPPPN